MKPKPQKCPKCKTKAMKVIYYGLPMLLCENEECNCLFGKCGVITDHLPFNGVMMAYQGSYIGALWGWFLGEKEG